MARAYNFSAGPATLPVEVLQKAQNDLVDYRGTGVSVMEMSHRSPEYKEIFYKAMDDLKTLMSIPDNYRILFLQGGATSQFGMVPLNLYGDRKRADYINTGSWSKKAIAEAKRYGTVQVVASSEDKNFTYIPEVDATMFDPDADYVHITTNNTIFGTVFPELPDTGSVPIAADMSSNILGQVYDVSRFGVIYAGAQKNIGPAGLTVLIVRDDLIGSELDITPKMYSYKAHADADSMLNTPPCFAVYMAGLVFEWLIDFGGVAAMESLNREKSSMLYDFLDNSTLFHSTVEPGSRSIMNVPFVTNDEGLDKRFIEGAAARGLKTLKGHRTVGGMRASIYNAMPREGVVALIDYMKEFEQNEK